MIRTLLTLLLAVLFTAGAFAQSKTQLPLKRKHEITAEKYIPPRHIEPMANEQDMRNYIPTAPIGSRTTNEVTVIKVGEASNAFSTLSSEANPLSALNGVGNGGVVAFAHRQNIQKCFPSNDPLDNGRIRYTISTDGGNTWSIGDGNTVSATQPPLQNQCLGIGPLTDIYTYRSRYPQGVLSLPSGSGNLEDVIFAVTSSTLDGQGGEWNGSANITVKGAATDSWQVTDESYDLASNDQSINGGLIERVPGEFWYVSRENISNDTGDNGDGTIFVYKGVFNASSGQVEWSLNNSLQPNHIVIPSVGATGPNSTTPNIAFSPDGRTGYISFAGDLIGGEDSVYSPVFIESTDGGETWGEAYEFNINSFPQIADSLQLRQFLDSIGVDDMGNPIFDTVTLATGKATLGFDHDLVVDANGNPHFLSTVGVGATTETAPGYSIFSGIYLMLFDFTKDEFGDWNMLHVSSINTFRGYFPQGVATNGDAITADIHTQLSRSADGTKIFMAWTDTDTTDANYQAIPDPDGTSNQTNIAPNLLTRVYDLTSNMMTPVENQTITDPTWKDGILIPKTAPITLNEAGSNIHTLPTLFANIDGATALLPTSYYYISDITFDVSQGFTEPALFYLNCKSTPFANVVEETQPACDAKNGEINVTAAGGSGPYTYKWEAIQGDTTVNSAVGKSVSNLGSGIYRLVVEDVNGCTDERIINLNNQDAPSLSLVSSKDISCFGAGDGSAEISVTGGTGTLAYSWSNGEVTANASMLPKGTSTVTVTDANNCQSFISVDINEPAELLVETNTTNVSCNGFSDGEVLARVQGGTRPYTYVWDNDGAGAGIQSLPAGSYSVTITDANGCITSSTAEVTQPESLELVLSATSANTETDPDRYTGSAFATARGGTPFAGSGLSYQFIWCGDTSENVQFKAGLPGGKCDVTIIDANGCSLTDTVFIDGITVNISDPQLGINELKLFPNPNAGQFNLQLALTARDQVAIRIFDMKGKLYQSRQLNQIINYQTAFDMSKAVEGVYLLSVTTSKGTTSQRIVVRK